VIVEYIRYALDAVESEAFEGAAATAGGELEQAAGCAGWELARSLESRGAYVLRVEWRSNDDIDAFKDTSGFAAVVAALGPFHHAAEPVALHDRVAGTSQSG
jgi:quinol monooxygenase YgiN